MTSEVRFRSNKASVLRLGMSRKATFGLLAWIMAGVGGAPLFAQDVGKMSDEAVLDAATRIVVERASKAVVTVDSLGDLEEGFVAPTSEADKSKGILAKAGFKQAYGPSSGVIVDSSGYIVTSRFVLARSPRHIIVTLHDGRSFVANCVGEDLSRGLAVLKIDPPSPLPTLPECPKEQIEPGQFSLALGRGYGAQSINASQGIISALGRVAGKALQSSALISPANYGGALVDIGGRLQGIIVPLEAGGGMAGVDLYDSGIGFAIPMSDLRALLPRLKNGETLKRPFLGVDLVDEAGVGLKVKAVVRRSAAERAGIEAGDVIKSVDGRPVATRFEFHFALGPKVAGDTIGIEVLREGVVKKLQATLGEFKDEPKSPGGADAEPGEGSEHDHGDGKDHGHDHGDGKDHGHDHDHDHDHDESDPDHKHE